MDWKIAGALAFGLVLGWNVYFVNRYRRGDISFGDLTTLIGVIGGAAVLLHNDPILFGAYGFGLGLGFFAYFIMLVGFVKISPNFDSDWFLDGRRKDPQEGYGYGTDARPTLAPMFPEPPHPPQPEAPSVNINFHGTNPGEASIMAPSATAPNTLSAPNPDATRIQRACAETWSQSGPSGPFKGASHLFVIEVAHRLGVSLSGTSDQIIDTVTGSASWAALADGPAARNAAAQGKLVIAGVRSDAGSPPRMDGQLAVVTAGAMNAGGWAPSGYWGSSDPEIAEGGGTGAPISDRFAPELKDKIIYRCRDI